MTDELKDIYVDYILEHYKHPRNFGEISNPDFTATDGNPYCGDVIRIDMKVEEGIIKDIKFKGSGCAISQAAASILTELMKGKPLDYAKEFTKDDMLDALGIPVGPARIKCALLAYTVLKAALKKDSENQ